MENDIQSNQYPDKPELIRDEVEHGNVFLKSIGSLLLFVIAFYFLFSKDITLIILLLVVLFIHELGHFVAMKYFKYRDVKMFFIPLLGAFVSGEKDEISQKERVIIILSGPVPGIIIGLILYFFGIEDNNQLLLRTAYLFIYINVFNLLPFIPLDGGRLIETLFFNIKETVQIVFLILSACAFALIAFHFESYILLIIPLFLLIRINYQSTLKKIRKSLDEKNIDYNKPYNQLTNEEYWLIREQIITIMDKAFNNVNPKDYTLSNEEKLVMRQVQSLYSHSQNQDLTGNVKIKLFLFWFLLITIPVYTANPLFSNFFVAQLTEEEQIVEGCVGEFASESYYSANMKEIREFCECYTFNLLQKFTTEDLILQSEHLTEEEILELHTPYAQNCIEELNFKLAN